MTTELICGDCPKVLQSLPSGSIDAVVTDPPYGMAFVSSRTKQRRRIAGDSDASLRDAALALCPSVPMAVFGTWKAPRPIGTRQVLIWDKTDGVGPGMGDLRKAFGSSHEEIYLIGDWPKAGPRQGSVLRTSCAMGSPYGLIAQTGHPTPKPVDLIVRILNACAPGTVLDPFMGSGSIGVACVQTGRSFIGIEIDPTYFAIAQRRIAEAQQQPALMVMP